MLSLPYHKDRMYDGNAPGWRQTMDRHHAALIGEVTEKLDAEVGLSVARAVSQERERAEVDLARAVSEQRDEMERALREERAQMDSAITAERARVGVDTRRRLSESLNQTLRRIRQTSAEHETLQLLLEESSPWAECAVVVLIENNQARITAWRGTSLRDDEEEATPIELSEAAAMASCVESGDPIVALAAPGEVSAVLASALGKSPSEKIYLFPVTARQNTVALMLACGEVTPAPVELLCEAAGMKLESLTIPAVRGVSGVEMPNVSMSAPVSGTLVQIGGVSNGTHSAKTQEAATWTKLSPEEQALHLRAQRMARVRVAQMRISESTELRKGAETGNIYRELKLSIDAARNEYQRAYMSLTSSMVDYLHLEIVRSLAHNDARLLGRDYPGPIA